MFKLIKQAIALLMVKTSYATIVQSTGLVSYADTIVNGVLDASLMIRFSDNEIYDNYEVWSPAMSILKKFGSQTFDTPIFTGKDRKQVKTTFTLGAAVTSQTALATEVNIKLAEFDKNHLSERMELRFNFAPTGTNYTNSVIVTAIYPATEDGSGGGSGSSKGNYWITVKPADATKYFGIANGTPVPISTKIMSTGTVFADKSGPATPRTFIETPVINYPSFIKESYSYGKITERYNLHAKGTLRYREDRDARKRFNQQKERQFLFGGKEVYKVITSQEQAATEAVSKMVGLLTAVKNGGSPAITTFGGESSFEAQHEAFIYNLKNSRIKENKRLVMCDDAYLKYWTDLKKNKPGIEISPEGAYGIPGITKIYTGYGDFVLDCIVSTDIAEWSRFATGTADLSLANPFAVALNPALVDLGELMPDMLETEIQTPGWSYRLAQYSCVMSWLGHNLDTENFGMIYNPTYWAQI